MSDDQTAGNLPDESAGNLAPEELERAKTAFMNYLKILTRSGALPWSPVESIDHLSEFVPVTGEWWDSALEISADDWPQVRDYVDGILRQWTETRRLDRLAGTFQTDGSGDGIFQAVAFGDRWNGWATPIVTREVFEDFVSACNGDETYYVLQFYGVAAVFTETEATGGDQYINFITPYETGDYAGCYDLGVLGWCFYRSDDFDN